MTAHFSNDQIASGREREAPGITETGLDGRPAGADGNPDSVSGNRVNRSVRADPPDPVISRVGNVKGARCRGRDASRAVQKRLDGGTAVTPETALASACTGKRTYWRMVRSNGRQQCDSDLSRREAPKPRGCEDIARRRPGLKEDGCESVAHHRRIAAHEGAVA